MDLIDWKINAVRPQTKNVIKAKWNLQQMTQLIALRLAQFTHKAVDSFIRLLIQLTRNVD